MKKYKIKFLNHFFKFNLFKVSSKVLIFYSVIVFGGLFLVNCAGDNPLNTDVSQKYLIKIKETPSGSNNYFSIGTEGKFISFNNAINITKFDLKTNITLLDLTINNDNIFVVGESGSLFRSNDAGNTWQKTQIPTNNKLNSVFFLDNKGWVAGAGGKIFHTTDNGLNWIDTSLVFPHNIIHIEFDANGNGFLVGADDNSNQNAIFYATNNFGNEWTEISLNNITNGEEIGGFTNVKKIGNNYYVIADNCIIKSNKLFSSNLTLDDFSLVFSTSDDNDFVVSSIVEFQNKTHILGYKGHNKGIIYNLTDDTTTEINQHILDGIADQTQNKMYLVGGFGYFIIENNGITTTKFEIK